MKQEKNAIKEKAKGFRHYTKPGRRNLKSQSKTSSTPTCIKIKLSKMKKKIKKSS